MKDVGNVCRVSVDGTDFRIYEWKPFWSGWYSHKFRGPGLRYEVGLCIRTGWIVWVHGPFPCGKWSDLTIFRKALKFMLPPGEKVHADLGYIGEPSRVVSPLQVDVHDLPGKEAQDIAASVRARHETVNKRFKQFEILKRVFRHDVQHHQPAFGACAVITQMAIERGEPLYKVDYDESKLQCRF
jgi:DDE superfamily endonuclease